MRHLLPVLHPLTSPYSTNPLYGFQASYDFRHIVTSSLSFDKRSGLVDILLAWPVPIQEPLMTFSKCQTVPVITEKQSSHTRSLCNTITPRYLFLARTLFASFLFHFEKCFSFYYLSYNIQHFPFNCAPRHTIRIASFLLGARCWCPPLAFPSFHPRITSPATHPAFPETHRSSFEGAEPLTDTHPPWCTWDESAAESQITT